MSIVSLANTLDVTVTVYDSFSDHDADNYFGTLTRITTIPASTTGAVQLIHPTSVLIVSDATTNAPVARLISSELFSTVPFGVGPADVEAMAQTMDFIALITQHPNDSLAETFKDLWKDTTKPLVGPVNRFFAQQPAYASCTFATYMMGITTAAQELKSHGKPLDQAVYSLRNLVNLLGGSWPADFPDIVVSKFTCDTKHEVLLIRTEIDLNKLPAQSDQALQFFGSLFNVKKLLFTVSFNYGLSLGVLGTRLQIGLDALHVPFQGLTKLLINKPTVTMDVSPLFKFVMFTVRGSIPFKIFDKAFEADVSMVIDNLEANFSINFKSEDKTSLPVPPVMKGVHFDEFGAGIGIFFEPISATLGLSGRLHIGEVASGTQVALADDMFAIVCQLVEEVPNPLYISFYVPQMHLTDVLTVFTNTQTALDVPVSFTNLSFRWLENPMAPVALPDGSLSNMGYGFSAAANISAFSFYGDVAIDLNNGLTADIEMAPLSLGSIVSIGGDGIGVNMKVDAGGNPIKNNQLPTKAAQQLALKNASSKQLVSFGGPVLKLRTFASPFLHVNGHVSLFEVEKVGLSANITKSGISFEVDFGGILTSKMSCTLADFHNLAASFQFGIEQTISLPKMAGFSLGSMYLQAGAGVHLSINTSLSDIIISVGGSFSFEGLDRSFGDFTADVHIQKVTDLLSAIVNHIEEKASEIFNDLLSTAEAWAGKVKQDVITAAASVASTLRNAYNQDADQIASTMKRVGYEVNDITEQLKQIFNPDQVASTLHNVFNLSATGIAQAMHQVGYAGDEVAEALKTIFGDDVQAVASALQTVYGWSAKAIGKALNAVGYTANQIGNAFKSLGGEFEDAANEILVAIEGGDCCVM
jgi:hypothetical protein